VGKDLSQRERLLRIVENQRQAVEPNKKPGATN
jgi:hypothetical protein